MPIEKKRTRRNRTRFFHDFRSSAPDPEKKSLSLKSLKKVVMKDRQEGTLGPRKGGMGVSPSVQVRERWECGWDPWRIVVETLN